MNIIVTGGTKGIGKAIVQKFAADKSNTVLVCARHQNDLDVLKNEIPNVEIFKCDVSKPNDAKAFAEWCLGFGVPDVVVNNAGSYLPGNTYDEQDGTLEKMIEVNLYSAYYVTKKLLPAMMENNSGHIFNMSSIAGLQAYEGGGSYSISKFALTGYTKNLRHELKPYGIKVTGVYPGAVYTDSWLGSGVPETRIMESNDIAEMIYAASKLSPQACVEDIVLRPKLGDL